MVSGGASHTQHSGHTRLSISSLCMGPGWAQGPTACLVLISSWRCWRGSYSVPAALVGGGALVHTPLPGAQGSGGQAPPRARGSPGQVSAGLST